MPLPDNIRFCDSSLLATAEPTSVGTPSNVIAYSDLAVLVPGTGVYERPTRRIFPLKLSYRLTCQPHYPPSAQPVVGARPNITFRLIILQYRYNIGLLHLPTLSDSYGVPSGLGTGSFASLAMPLVDRVGTDFSVVHDKTWTLAASSTPLATGPQPDVGSTPTILHDTCTISSFPMPISYDMSTSTGPIDPTPTCGRLVAYLLADYSSLAATARFGTSLSFRLSFTSDYA